MPARRYSLAVALGLGVILVTSSCSVHLAADVKPTSAGPRTSGASLSILRLGPVAAWDPQRLSVGAEMAFAGRVFERTLTAWAPATEQDTLPDLAPDLATDTGTVSAGGRGWRFTLRSDAKWQDGEPVTCADVKYGISRTFATTQITGGSTVALALLDVPRNTDGSSTYAGPYLKTGQAGFDKAVTCSGQTITFRLARPVPEFNQVVALPAFGPVRADKDRGAQSALEIFSNGPYMLKTAWTPSAGGTFVRNPHWDMASDSIRKARPPQIVYKEGIPVETAISSIMGNARSDSLELTGDSAPPVLQHNIMSTPAIKALSTNPRAPFVDYLLPNFSRPTMASLKVRQALAVATNREAYVTALGGDTAAESTYAMINKSLPAYRDVNPLNVPPRGDAARSRSLLQASGLAMPVKITVVYRQGAIADTAMAALQNGWQNAGFSVTLKGLESDYFTTITSVQNSRAYDVMWAVGSAEWPSGSSVIPSLFDSRLNLTASSSGQDYGRFASQEFNAKIDAAAKIADASQREKAWGDLDVQLATQVAAIALTNQKYMYVHGGGVKNYIDNPALASTVDLATVDVAIP
ncbi:MAG: ABC transporter substrate-binding protein [Phycicoccus sp.]|nr:ABC transporter substrate-binding protein [Phycicoccus sp.]